MEKHTLSVLVENEFGVLTRIAGLFSGRGYNIESLCVAPTLDKKFSRMTIVTLASPDVMEQIVKQLNKLVNVLKVQTVADTAAVNRELALIKVNLGKRNQLKLSRLLKPFGAEIVDADERCSVVQIVTDDEGLEKIIEALSPHGIMEYVATGNIALQKGKKVMSA